MGLGTAINAAAVPAGESVGTLVGARLPDGVRATAMQAIGVGTTNLLLIHFLKLATTPTQTVPTSTVVAVR